MRAIGRSGNPRSLTIAASFHGSVSVQQQLKEEVYLGHQDGSLRLMALVEFEHVSKRELTDDITAASSRGEFSFQPVRFTYLSCLHREIACYLQDQQV